MENKKDHHVGSSKRRLREVPEVSAKRIKMDSQSCSITIRANNSTRISISSNSSASFSATIHTTSRRNVDVTSSVSLCTKGNRTCIVDKRVSRQRKDKKLGSKHRSAAGTTTINIGPKTNAQRLNVTFMEKKTTSTSNNVTSGDIHDKRNKKHPVTKTMSDEQGAIVKYQQKRSTVVTNVINKRDTNRSTRKRSEGVRTIASKDEARSGPVEIKRELEKPTTSREAKRLTPSGHSLGHKERIRTVGNSTLNAAIKSETEPRESKRKAVFEYEQKANNTPNTETSADVCVKFDTSGSKKKRLDVGVPNIAAIGLKEEAPVQIKHESDKATTSSEKILKSPKYLLDSKEKTEQVLRKSELKKNLMKKEVLERMENAVQEWNKVFQSSYTLHKKPV